MTNFFKGKASRVVAVIQFMSALSYVEGANYVLTKLGSGQVAPQLLTLALSVGLTALNLTAGWKLLDKNQLGYKLSLANLAAQVLSLNLPFFAYRYRGNFTLFASTSNLFIDPPDFKIGYLIGSADFIIRNALIANLYTIEINLFSLVLFVLLFREYRRSRT